MGMSHEAERVQELVHHARSTAHLKCQGLERSNSLSSRTAYPIAPSVPAEACKVPTLIVIDFRVYVARGIALFCVRACAFSLLIPSNVASLTDPFPIYA